MDIAKIESLIKKKISIIKKSFQLCEACGKNLTEDFDATSTIRVDKNLFEIEEDICQECAHKIEDFISAYLANLSSQKNYPPKNKQNLTL
ncbi:MAG: hypothetical protein OXB84_01555 [Halobacteriovoraceae bacterium]|nr:hypothetical protein [Halobacteriovoraceae bacterium]